ncbi:Multidrug resistance protein 1 [Diplonema papillatum]|nr:Multidrug resistance protein 1 [Diplonema papillatum]
MEPVEEDKSKIDVLIDVDDTIPVDEFEGKKVSAAELFKYARGSDRVLLVTGIIGAMATGCTLPVFSIIFGGLIEEASGADESEVGDQVAYWAKWMFIAGAGVFVAGCLMASCFAMCGERQINTIRKAYFEAVMRQEPAWFDIHKTGALTARLHGDTKIIHTGISERASFFFMHTTTIISSYTIGFVYSWRLTLILLSLAPLLGISGVLMFLSLTTMTTKSRKAYGSAGAIAEEVLSSMRTIHSLSAHTQFREKFDAEIDNAREVSKYSGFVTGGGIAFAMACMFGSYALGLFYASFLIEWNLNSVADILTAFFAVLFGSFSLGQVIPPITSFAKAQVSAYKIFRVIDRIPRIEPGTQQLPNLKGKINFDGVTFRYPSRMHRPVIVDLNLEIEAGSTAAFVGLSGCGKSSLVSMVQRFYEPAKGYYGVKQMDGSFRPFPYESNLALLDAVKGTSNNAGGSAKTITLHHPINMNGTCVKECVVTLSNNPDDDGDTCTVKDSDGTVRVEDDKWYWVEKPNPKEDECLEFLLPTRVSRQLNQALVNQETIATVEVGFGTYTIDLKKMTRTNIAQQVLYQPNGKLLVDDVPIGQLDLDWWRDSIGMVTQEPVLFSGSVLDNIRMGRKEATLEEVIEACQQAHIHHVIERWPEAYETKVGEGGCQLSGGQKQRIAIARAVIKRPKILILDEATSALDRESEVKVQTALQSIMKSASGDVTTLVIAHRLQTVMHADKIVVMQPPTRGLEQEGAKIVESGTHAELLAKEGHYAALWNAQNRVSSDANEENTAAETGAKVADEDERAPVQVKTAEELELEKKQKMEEKIKKKTSLARVARLAAPWYPWLVPGLLGAVITGAVYPVYALVFSNALDILAGIDIGTRDRNDITVYIILFLAVAAGAFVGNLILDGAFGYIGAQVTAKLRKMLFAHYLKQDMSFFDVPDHESGELAAALSGQTEAIHNLFGVNLGMLLRILVNFGGGFAIAFAYQWKVTLVVLALAPVLVISGYMNALIMSSSFGGGESGTGRLASEAITNIKTVISFNGQPTMLEMFSQAGDAQVRAKIKRALGQGIAYGVSQFFMFAVFGVAFWYGGSLISDGEADFKDVTTAVMEVVMASMGVGEAVGMQGASVDARAAAATVFEMLDTPPQADQMATTGKTDCITNGTIKFTDVTFTYPTRPNIQVLKNFSLTIQPKPSGMQVGLIGSTGSGKSTVMQILQRFYSLEDCGTGTVSVDGIDLSSINLQYWRSLVGVVSQEPMLFAMSVLDNIRLGKPDATMEEVREACKLAHISAEIEKLPQGYFTNVGARGSMLSGGQKQRVAIARAVVKNPKLLLLDEATSALDNTSEAEVQKALDHIIETQSMTTVTIAHKLTTIEAADQITVLDRGNLIEQGTHEELMKIPNGDYKSRYLLYHSLE